MKGVTSYVHDDLSKMIQHTTGAAGTSATGATPTTPTTPAVLATNKKFQVPVTPLPEYLAYSSMGLIDSQPLLLKVLPNLSNCACNVVDKDKDVLSDMKNTGPDINTGIEVVLIQYIPLNRATPARLFAPNKQSDCTVMALLTNKS